MKNPILPCPYLVKKRKFCQNYTILWAQKVNRMPFIPIFTNKYQPSCPHFLQNNVYYQKKKLLSCPYFVKKTSILSKTVCSHVTFSIFLWKTPAVMPSFGQKNVNSVKTTLYYGTNKVYSMPFCWFFMK